MRKYIKQNWMIILVLVISALLRFADLGRQSYWYDESAEATAATLPTIGQAIELSRIHTGAMPLDYMEIWVLGHVSLQESWLRIAPAVWGVATVFVLFIFSKRIGGKTIALIASALLALSPVHIYFSQELRYYSALIFFYWLLSLFLYNAVEKPTWKNWIWVILISIIGTYFHMFVLFAWLNGAVFWLAKYKFSLRSPILWRRVIPSLMIVGGIVIPGLIIFGSESSFSYPLNSDLLASQIMIAFGWLPAYYSRVGFILGFSLLLAAGIGFAIVIRQKLYSIVGMAAVTLIQIVAIILAAIHMGYFFAARQFIFLLPVTFLLAGFAINQLLISQTPLLRNFRSNLNFQKINQILALGIFVGLVLASFANIINDYQYSKSSARQISYLLSESWHPGDEILVIPVMDQHLYQFYFENIIVNSQIPKNITPTTWEALSQPTASTKKVFLLTESVVNNEDWEKLKKLGFRLVSDVNAPNLMWVY